jgi:serine protease Do
MESTPFHQPARHYRVRLWIVLALALTLVAGIAIGTLVDGEVKANPVNVVSGGRALAIPSPRQLASEFTGLAKQVEPSVVHIRTDYLAGPGDEEDDQSEEWQKFFQGPHKGVPPRAFRRESSGSGFIVDSSGFILTNYHVVERADHIRVTLPHQPGSEFRARLVGFDKETDLAVIKVDPKGPLPALAFGNSDSVQVGDWAVAIGSPFGLEATVTAGIVSATGRDLEDARQFQKFIQTDAAINPGNSGGPLLNIRGEVIGINTAIATENGGYQGIGFAMPANVAVHVYNQLVKTGKVQRGSIGVGWDKRTQPVTLKAFGYQSGLLVERVEPGGPAEKAGIQAEDILLELDGKPVKDGDELVARISVLPIGSEVTARIDRGGTQLSKKVKIEDRNEVFKNDPRFADDSGTPPKAPAPTRAKPSLFGLGIRPLSSGRLASARIESGMEVIRVEPNSFAEEIGLAQGDILVAVNRQPIRSVADITQLQSKLRPGDPVAFRVMRPEPGARGSNFQSFYRAGTLPWD